MSISVHEKSISRVLAAIEAIQNGKMVIMTDDEDRENEGDLILAAECVTPENINFMAKEARGLICLAMDAEYIDRLQLPMMDMGRSDHERSTAFTVSIEARHGVTTGISAKDRATTIAVAVADDTKPQDITVPGHIFPLRARRGGVLERAGHTEGSVDLAKLAGLKGAGVICEIMNDDGTMARADDLDRFAAKHDLVQVTIADLVAFRLMKDSLVTLLKESPVKTSAGIFQGFLFESLVDGSQHFALCKGQPFDDRVIDVRVHNQRPLVDVFADPENGGRQRMQCGLDMLKETDQGVLLYLARPSEREAMSLDFDQLAADANENSTWEDTLSKRAKMDMRHVGTGAQILKLLGVEKMRVHSLSTKPLKGLSGFGLEIVEMMSMKGANHE